MSERIITRKIEDLKGGYLMNDVRALRRGLSVPNIQRRRNVTLPPLSQTPSITNTNTVSPTPVVLPAISLPPWVADEDCKGKVDPITEEEIKEGRGFKLMENEVENCYDVETLAKIMRLRNPLTPYTRVPFSEIDKKRIIDYTLQHPIGGNKKKGRKTKKVTRKNRRNRKNRKSKKNRKY